MAGAGRRVCWLRPWAWLSLASVPTLLIYAVLAGALQGQPFNVRGGFSWPCSSYAFWEPLVAGHHL